MEDAYYQVDGNAETYGPLSLQEILNLEAPVTRFTFSRETPEWIHMRGNTPASPQYYSPPLRQRPPLLSFPRQYLHTEPRERTMQLPRGWWLIAILHTLLSSGILVTLILTK